MIKKRKMMMTTLTCGWIHTADRPRLSGSPMCFTHVLLSKRVLIASRGINCERGKQKGAVLQGCSVLPLFIELIPHSHFSRVPSALFSGTDSPPWAKVQMLRSLRNIWAVSSSACGPVLAQSLCPVLSGLTLTLRPPWS